MVNHELNKSWSSFEYEVLFGKKDVICKLLHAHVEHNIFLGRLSLYEVVKDIVHKRKTKKIVFEWNCLLSSKGHIAKIFAIKHI